MRATNRISRHLTHAYLYSDGTLVEIFEESRDHVTIGTTADITYGYCEVFVYPSYSDRYTSYHPEPPKGRIVFPRGESGIIKLAKGGRITGIGPSISGGSEKTKKLGYEVQYVMLKTKAGVDLQWCDCTSILGSAYTVQADAKFYHTGEALRVGYSLWNDHTTHVCKITDLRPKPAVIEKEVA